MTFWRNLISGIQFLTLIPGGSSRPFDARRTIPFFPLCGLLIGVLLAGVDSAAALLWDRPAVAVLDVLALVLISGALHLDGLADTADGLYGRRTPEQSLTIMKDSRIGAIGMVAVSCCLAVKWAGLSNLGIHRFELLILIPAFARASVLFGIRMLPYGRPQGGTGHAFFQHPLRTVDFWGIVMLAGLSFVWIGSQAFWLIGGFGCLCWSCILYYRTKINCITGDMLGAMIEIQEAGLFLILAAMNNNGTGL
jgi:adenosylcobinamide-GDP ribazoletransferase